MVITRRSLAGTAAFALLTACGSSGGGGGSTTGFAGALDSVSATGAVGNIARMRELGIIDDAKHSTDPRWSRVAGVGFERLANYTALLPGAIGLDVYRADRAMSVGRAPNTAIRIDGAIDAGAVTSKLKSLGAKARTFDGTTGLSFGTDNSIDPAGPLSQRLHMVNELDQVVVDPHRFAASPSGTALGPVLGHGDPLLDAPHMRQIADCLGDVVAAIVSTPPRGHNSAVIAVGVRDPGSLGKPHEEVVCSAPADGRSDAVRAAFGRSFALSAVDPRSREPLSHYVGAAKVDTPDGTVRAVLTVQADQSPGYVFVAYQVNGATSWDGS